MAKAGTLVVDGVEYAGIEYLARFVPGAVGGQFAGGTLWLAPSIRFIGQEGEQLILDGQSIRIVGTGDDGSVEFAPV